MLQKRPGRMEQKDQKANGSLHGRIVSTESQLDLLESVLPNWAHLSRDGSKLVGDVHLPRPNGGTWPELLIEVSGSGAGKLQAREFPPARWPTFCPQRHINSGGYFCLGLTDVPSVETSDDAVRWWLILADHLQLQFTADARRLWPREREWDHGAAGETQFAMEKLAGELGWLPEVRAAHVYNQGWLATDLPRLSKQGDRLVNGRSQCPRRCSRKSRQVLRRNCKHKEEVVRLVQLELKRRRQLENFWKIMAAQTCCGRMNNCPLKKGE